MNTTPLQELSGSARLLWLNADARRQRVVELNSARQLSTAGGTEEPANDRIQQLLDAFTDDIRAGMQISGWNHVDLERHPIRFQVKRILANGITFPPRDVEISERLLASIETGLSADSVVRTWVQELVHVRAVIPDDYWLETHHFTGYEEGLAEGVARLLVIQDAGMHPLLGPYSHYAYSYGQLASVLEVSPKQLFSRLWVAPMGRVREWFPEVVRSILEDKGLLVLSERRTRQLREIADDLFDESKTRAPVDLEALQSRWEEALR